MILADKVAVAAEVAGVSDVLNLKTQRSLSVDCIYWTV